MLEYSLWTIKGWGSVVLEKLMQPSPLDCEQFSSSSLEGKKSYFVDWVAKLSFLLSDHSLTLEMLMILTQSFYWECASAYVLSPLILRSTWKGGNSGVHRGTERYREQVVMPTSGCKQSGSTVCIPNCCVISYRHKIHDQSILILICSSIPSI